MKNGRSDEQFRKSRKFIHDYIQKESLLLFFRKSLKNIVIKETLGEDIYESNNKNFEIYFI